MKLYLSSTGIPSPRALENLLGATLASCRAALIPNAKDAQAADHRAGRLRASTEPLVSLGAAPITLDLRDFDAAEDVANALAKIELLWVVGGDPHVLRSAMRRSGFDLVIGRALDSGLVYGSESAGSIVAGTSLRGFERPENLGHVHPLVWEGLGLVDHVVLPHVDVPFFAEPVARVREFHATDHILELRDGEALVIAGQRRQVESDPR